MNGRVNVAPNVQWGTTEGPDAASRDSWLQILLDVADSISSADNLDRALNRLAWLALKATGADRSAILVPDPQDPLQIQPAAGASRVGDLAVLWERFRQMDPVNLRSDLRIPTLWHSTQAMVIEDVPSSELIPEMWKRVWGSKSIAYAPLRASGDMLGILAVDYAITHRFDEDELKLLEAIASSAGVALRSASLVERLQRSVSIERRLRECGTALLAGRSLDEVLGEIADRFASLLPDSVCGINLVNADGTGFRTVAWRGSPPPQEEIRLTDLPTDELAAIRELWQRTPRQAIVIPDTRKHPAWEPYIPEGVGTGMLVPLVEGRETLGFVAVGRTSVSYDDEEVGVASAFADQAAIALVQARLTETAEVRLKLVDALSRLDDAVVRSSNLRSVLRTLNRHIGREIGVRFVRLSFADRALAEVLQAPHASIDERKQIQAWRRTSESKEITKDDLLAIPVKVNGRPAGIFWVKSDPVDTVRLHLIRAMGSAIGEVAHKAKLHRKAVRSARELAIAADRERIARDLHDTIGQTFYGIGLRIQDMLFDVTDPVLREKLGELRVMASDSVAGVRSAVYALSFSHVRESGLVPSIRALAVEFTRATAVDTQVRVFGSMTPLAEDVQSVLYRVAHEALVNVERHSRATGVVISISEKNDVLELSIRDDGVGMGQREASDWQVSAHFGMRMMAKSIHELGGSFAAIELKPRGLLIKASIPLTRRTIGRQSWTT
jgi:signal transduction histidine kinase